MVTYPLAHLTQPDDQKVGGPIQDDEALLLFAIVRVMRLRRILEFGGQSGYSARNFLQAVGPTGIVFSVDLETIPSLAPNHITLCMNAADITANDVGDQPLDLVFFDCHAYAEQMETYERLLSAGVIIDRTVLALHDTNLHPQNFFGGRKVPGGWRHIATEARMVNDFKQMGYDIVCFHTEMSAHSEELPYRWGITIARRFRPLAV